MFILCSISRFFFIYLFFISPILLPGYHSRIYDCTAPPRKLIAWNCFRHCIVIHFHDVFHFIPILLCHINIQFSCHFWAVISLYCNRILWPGYGTPPSGKYLWFWCDCDMVGVTKIFAIISHVYTRILVDFHLVYYDRCRYSPPCLWQSDIAPILEPARASLPTPCGL